MRTPGSAPDARASSSPCTPAQATTASASRSPPGLRTITSARRRTSRCTAAAEHELAALLDDQLTQPIGDRGEVAHARRRDVQRGDRPHVRLDPTHPGGVQLGDLDAVRPAPADQLGHPGQLGGLGGHHQLPGDGVRQVVLPAERHGLRAPGHREPRLGAARGVVQPRVDHVRVVPTLVRGQPRLALDDRDAAPAAGHCVGGGQPDDAATDHDDVVSRGAHPVAAGTTSTSWPSLSAR